MRTSIAFKLGAVVVGGLVTAVFTIGFSIPSKGWAQATIPEVVDLAPNLVQVTPWRGQEIRTDSIQIARGKRPAATQESPEELQKKNLPQAIPPEELRQSSKADLINECNQQPKCRAKMQGAQPGNAPKNRRPAAREESPEEKAFKQLPKPPQNVPGHQRSQRDFLHPTQEPSLLGRLNPFGASEAFAQTTVSVHLEPRSPWTTTPYSGLYAIGINFYNPSFLYLTGYNSVNTNYTENNPYASVSFNAPASGYYIINFTATSSKAKLRHQYNGPIIETWDKTSICTRQCNYATFEYLEQGYHYFYFWPEGNLSLTLYAVDITSYP